jgi:hypothetical protein
MEWIKPAQLTPQPHGGAPGDADQILTFDMLRALIAARQSVSAARCTVARESNDHGGQVDDPQSILRVFATGPATTPLTALKLGQSDA